VAVSWSPAEKVTLVTPPVVEPVSVIGFTETSERLTSSIGTSRSFAKEKLPVTGRRSAGAA
jgi:hypothetical protein